MNNIRENPQLSFDAARVFFKKNEEDFDLDKIAEVFMSAGVTFNFVYIIPKDLPTQSYLLVDNSGDFYCAMSIIAGKTGGKSRHYHPPQKSLKIRYLVKNIKLNYYFSCCFIMLFTILPEGHPPT
jgi:hypothetical protein